MARIRGQGSNWIRRSTRYAIYHRDGHACVYCEAKAAEGVVLSLDHVVPQELGGGHGPDNLVTACFDCNSAKRHLSMREWVAFLRDKGVETEGLAARVRRRLAKKLDRAEGRRLEAETETRGSEEF
jgi:5-methylcytosine-specific restriction endonuclease McrA